MLIMCKLGCILENFIGNLAFFIENGNFFIVVLL